MAPPLQDLTNVRYASLGQKPTRTLKNGRDKTKQTSSPSLVSTLEMRNADAAWLANLQPKRLDRYPGTTDDLLTENVEERSLETEETQSWLACSQSMRADPRPGSNDDILMHKAGAEPGDTEFMSLLPSFRPMRGDCYQESTDNHLEKQLVKQAAEIRSLRATKAALTELGRGYFAAHIQRLARGVAARAWRAYAMPLVVRLQASLRGSLARILFRAKKRASTRIAAFYRSATKRAEYCALYNALLTSQRFARGAAHRALYVELQQAAIVVTKRVRALLSQAYRRRCLKAAVQIATAYRGHAVRRADAKLCARRFQAAAASRRLLRLLLCPPQDTVILSCTPGSAQIKAKLKPDGQPFGIALKFDPATGDLGIFFSFNPHGDLRHVLAPWVVRGKVVVCLLNQHKLGNDVTVVLDTVQPETRYAALVRPAAAYTVGVQRLLTQAQLKAEFYYEDHRTILIAVVNDVQEQVEITRPITCFAKPMIDAQSHAASVCRM